MTSKLIFQLITPFLILIIATATPTLLQPSDNIDRSSIKLLKINSQKSLITYTKNFYDSDIAAIFINEEGGIIGSEIDIVTNNLFCIMIDVIKTSDNKIIFIWEQLSSSQIFTSLTYAKIYDLELNELKSAFQIAQNSAKKNTFNRLIELSNNQILAIWHEKDSQANSINSHKILALKMDSSGVTIGSISTLIAFQKEDTINSGIQIESFTDQFLITIPRKENLQQDNYRIKSYIFTNDLTLVKETWISDNGDNANVPITLKNSQSDNIILAWVIKNSQQVYTKLKYSIMDSTLTPTVNTEIEETDGLTLTSQVSLDQNTSKYILNIVGRNGQDYILNQISIEKGTTAQFSTKTIQQTTKRLYSPQSLISINSQLTLWVEQQSAQLSQIYINKEEKPSVRSHSSMINLKSYLGFLSMFFIFVIPLL